MYLCMYIFNVIYSSVGNETTTQFMSQKVFCFAWSSRYYLVEIKCLLKFITEGKNKHEQSTLVHVKALHPTALYRHTDVPHQNLS